jgi:hypothetical protein
VKKIVSLATSVALVAICAATTAVYAKDGPNLATLVPVDENRYDIANKKSVDRSDVLNRLTKDTFYREIFEVKEVQTQPQTAYIVRESRPVARTVTDEQEVFVRVNKVPQVNAPAWSYINR